MTAWGNLPPALPPHGTVLAWVRGCRCEECEREYQRFVSELAVRVPPRLPAEPEPRKLDADTLARLEPAVSQSECPVCGAPRHERCRNLAFPQHFAPTHPERTSRVHGLQHAHLATWALLVARLVLVADDGVRGGRSFWGAELVVEFGILGPVQVVRDGRVLGPGGPRRRALLALLLVARGQVVPAERLAEDLWGGCPPPGAAGTLRAHVSRLRTLLSPDALLVAQGGGYALAPGQLDAARFERLAGAGREALEGGDAAAAANHFRAALGLWRGRALADVTDVEPLAREGARLEELRLLAVEGRVEADLALGRHAEVIGELEGLVAEHPVRERLWRLLVLVLVLALYRSGRQGDALAAYRQAREMLAEELGIEPGRELKALEQAVLRQEVPAPPPSARHNLPVRLTSFLGRERELAALEKLVGERRLVTLTGAGGAGKTRLALEFAVGAAQRFGDGVWLAGLSGIADPRLVASVVADALGLRQSGDVPVTGALCSRLRSAELLLVLDNCEHLLGGCAELAVALLGSCPRLRVLATSREVLGVPGEAVYAISPLPVPAESSDAEALAREPAVRLFLERGRTARAAAAPVEIVAGICRELDGLPLAIELAAARTSVLSAEEIAVRLADKFRFLADRRPMADPRHRTLKTVIGWSYDLLSLAGRVEVIAGDHVAAEQHLRHGYEALRAMGERGHRASLATWLAEAVYAQGRLGEALQLTEEAEALGGVDDYEVQGRWRAIQAKLLARRGQFPAAMRLAEEAVALVPATVDPPERAEFLLAWAEVYRLCGALDEAEACARRALQFYQDRQMVPLAERARALIGSLIQGLPVLGAGGYFLPFGRSDLGRRVPRRRHTRSSRCCPR